MCLTSKHDIQRLDESQRTLANSDLQLKGALVIGSYAGQVHTDAMNVLYALYLGKYLQRISQKYDHPVL